jgi:hypothetical protein
MRSSVGWSASSAVWTSPTPLDRNEKGRSGGVAPRGRASSLPVDRFPAAYVHHQDLGDFSQQSYQLACPSARLPCCAKGYIAGLCAPLRASEADENPAQSGNFVSSIRLRHPRRNSRTGRDNHLSGVKQFRPGERRVSWLPRCRVGPSPDAPAASR